MEYKLNKRVQSKLLPYLTLSDFKLIINYSVFSFNFCHIFTSVAV